MLELAIHEEAAAALNRLQEQHSDLKQQLQQAYGYAVFPSVGRAGAVLGGAFGQGEVFEQGKPVGFAIMSQITIGVQVGGQTFTEILTFQNKDTFDKFKKRTTVSFTANASAVIVKAAATATSKVKNTDTKVYSSGGMLLEVSLGGSRFMFVPPLDKMPEAKMAQKIEDTQLQPSQEKREQNSGSQQGSQQQSSSGNPASKMTSQIGHWAQDAVGKIPVLAKVLPHDGNSPLSIGSKIVSGVQKELSTNKTLRTDVEAAIKMIEETHPDFKKSLDEAYGYAIFPSIGRAGLVLGCAYGKGEVFEKKNLVGYAGIVQITIGIQLGGETFTAAILFSDKAGYDKFKEGKVAFTANAGAVIIKAGAEATTRYRTDRVYLFSEGGLLIEAAIGGQKVVYRPAVLTHGQSSEQK